MDPSRSIVPASLILAALIAAPHAAEACSAACGIGSFVPASGTVAANLPAIRWNPESGFSDLLDASAVGLFQVTSGGEVAVAITTTQEPTGSVLVQPAAPLQADGDYVVRGGNTCNGSGKVDSTATQASFHTGATAPFPSSPGTLTLATPHVGTLEVSTASGSCTAEVTAAQAEIQLAPTTDSMPWQGALEYQVLVDGSPWLESASQLGGGPPGGGRLGVLFTTCETGDRWASKGVTPGTHSVVVRASMPGWSSSVDSAPVSVTLECPASADGGTGVDGGTGSPAVEGDPGGGGTEGGGGCSVGAAAPGAGAGWAALVVAALMAWRKRRE